jgi:two-component system nitrate/nitrite response regulator NarP
MPAAARPLRVAVVDDNEDIRVLVGLHLELDERFECKAQAATGTEALALAGREDIDVVVLDMHMPEVTGTDVLRAIRATNPVMRVVAFSADQQILSLAALEGADATVLKGDTFEGLVEALLSAPRIA